MFPINNENCLDSGKTVLDTGGYDGDTPNIQKAFVFDFFLVFGCTSEILKKNNELRLGHGKPCS